MGKRIKDTSISEQVGFSPTLRVLVDKMDADPGYDWLQAKNMQLKYLGNTYFQGSTNNTNWHDNITSLDSYIRFCTDGGLTWKDLSTDTVREGTNLYFTPQRVLAIDVIDEALNEMHEHTNFTLLENIIDTGDGSSFLTDAGTYFNVLGGLTEDVIPVKGALGFVDSPIFVDGTSVKIGDATNNTEIQADGSIIFNGTATVFNDIAFDAIALQETGPGVSINSTESTVDFITTSNQLDYMFVNVQFPDSRKNGATVYPHIHFFQAQAGAPNFALQYRWQKNGTAKTTAWTAVKCNTLAVTYASGTINQIAYVNGGITPPSGDGLSDILQLRIIRDTTNALGLAYGADPYGATVSVIQCDVHYEIDQIGSKTEYSK